MSAPLFIVPGLGDSGPDHWQSHLASAAPGSFRLRLARWDRPDLDEWARDLQRQIPAEGPGVVLVAHSFGCLASALVIRRRPDRIRAALLVAPADPVKFGVAARLPRAPLARPVVLVASDDDPWCPAGRARALARRWEAQFLSIGRAGHINVDSGHGRWPFGERLAETLARLYAEAPETRLPRRLPPATHSRRAHP